MLFCGWLCCGNWCYGVNYEIGINYKIGRGKFFLIKLIESYGKGGGGWYFSWVIFNVVNVMIYYLSY